MPDAVEVVRQSENSSWIKAAEELVATRSQGEDELEYLQKRKAMLMSELASIDACIDIVKKLL